MIEIALYVSILVGSRIYFQQAGVSAYRYLGIENLPEEFSNTEERPSEGGRTHRNPHVCYRNGSR